MEFRIKEDGMKLDRKKNKSINQHFKWFVIFFIVQTNIAGYMFFRMCLPGSQRAPRWGALLIYGDWCQGGAKDFGGVEIYYLVIFLGKKSLASIFWVD